jgi:large subunit ribosomal protein L1
MHQLFKRFYDTKAYQALKKKNKSKEASTDFPQIKSLLSFYSLGVKGPVYGLATISNVWDKPLKGSFNFPSVITNNNNSSSIVAVLAKGELADSALKFGAQITGGEELIQDILEEKIKVDTLLCTKEFFPNLIKVAKFLGPRGLMPSPAKGMVSDDVEGMLSRFTSSVYWELDTESSNRITLQIGDSDSSPQDLELNFDAFCKSINSKKPSKWTNAENFITCLGICTLHSPAIDVSLKFLKKNV